VIDLHLHTSRCGHATGTVAEFVEAGRAAGIGVMCFTDHLPMPESYPQHYTMGAGELDAYMSDVRAAAKDSKAAGGPEILCGIEADWLPGSMDVFRDLVASRDFDMVLGSVHFVDGWAFDDPDLVERYATVDVDALWDRYFAEVAAAAGSGLFDAIAHPDLVKKFGFFPSVDATEWYERAASALAESGCAVEVNTAGLRKPVGEIYPSLPMLRACRRYGVPATTGSDAHVPGEVGAGLASARALLRDAGYDSLVVFRNRRAEEVPL
jgi:histidinol-phosphatase (PHP family)